jgi:hypothetical protein
VIVTSAPCELVFRIESIRLRMVSVITNVPATNPTPRATAIAVLTRRHRCARIPFRVARHMVRPPAA